MSHCQITLSVNAGVALHLGAMRVWSDALHDRRVVDQFPQRTRGHAAVRHLHGAFDRAADAHAEPRMSRDFNRHFPFASFPAWSDHFLTSILILHIF